MGNSAEAYTCASSFAINTRSSDQHLKILCTCVEICKLLSTLLEARGYLEREPEHPNEDNDLREDTMSVRVIAW